MNQRPSGYEPDELPTAPPRDKMVEGVGFEPTKRNAADLQSAPFSHSGTPPLKSSGADNRNRTYNLRFTKPLLCLLSYVSMISVTVSIIHETAEFVNCFFISLSGNPQKNKTHPVRQVRPENTYSSSPKDIPMSLAALTISLSAVTDLGFPPASCNGTVIIESLCRETMTS